MEKTNIEQQAQEDAERKLQRILSEWRRRRERRKPYYIAQLVEEAKTAIYWKLFSMALTDPETVNARYRPKQPRHKQHITKTAYVDFIMGEARCKERGSAMKILKLHLENFQGVKDFEICPNGESCSVYGITAQENPPLQCLYLADVRKAQHGREKLLSQDYREPQPAPQR